MDNYQNIKFLIAQFSGQQNIIGVSRVFCQFMGSLEGGVFLSQLVFWSDKSSRADGFFYKTYEEWEEETMLSEYKVRKYSAQLEKLGILETKLQRANAAPTVHYRFDSEIFTILILNFLGNDSENFKNPSPKISESLTEITTEITQMTETESAQGAQPPVFLPDLFSLSVAEIKSRQFTREQYQGVFEAERARGTDARKSLLDHIQQKLSLNNEPAIRVYRDETHYYPPDSWKVNIVEKVGRNGGVDLWRQVVAAYVGLGWNPRNVKAMLEWFERGEIPTTTPAKAKATPRLAADEAAAPEMAARLEKLKGKPKWTQ